MNPADAAPAPPPAGAGSVAVVDVGSNSIKLLVAARAEDGALQALAMQTLEARISAGLSAERPQLGAEGIARGVAAIGTLLDAARLWRPARAIVVATSAVRDAANGAEFVACVRAATGERLRILSGDEEAALIGRGLLCDPGLVHLSDFEVYDLGGGSLECLSFQGRKLRQALSLPLGCVRLTEKFVRHPNQPLDEPSRSALCAQVETALGDSGFRFPSRAEPVAVGTGGTFTTVRAIRAAAAGLALEATEPAIPVPELAALAERLGRLPLAERQTVPGLPRKRADVFPAALLTLLTLAKVGGIGRFRHSFYNLRWGLAAETLGAAGD
jgi:exopolyphosphatase/guanosine-5'-triphosphate,3'-diphosphate pyrophosphatase